MPKIDGKYLPFTHVEKLFFYFGKMKGKQMNTFIEILKVILPACITGLVTFMITKYTYYRNVPLDTL